MDEIVYWRVTKAFSSLGTDFPTSVFEGSRRQLQRVLDAFGYMPTLDETLWVKDCGPHAKWYIGLSTKESYELQNR